MHWEEEEEEEAEPREEKNCFVGNRIDNVIDHELSSHYNSHWQYRNGSPQVSCNLIEDNSFGWSSWTNKGQKKKGKNEKTKTKRKECALFGSFMSPIIFSRQFHNTIALLILSIICIFVCIIVHVCLRTFFFIFPGVHLFFVTSCVLFRPKQKVKVFNTLWLYKFLSRQFTRKLQSRWYVLWWCTV